MNDKFRIIMDSVDDELLEEAMEQKKSVRYLPWLSAAVAACLLLMLSIPLLRPAEPSVTLKELSDMGYELAVPEAAEQISYALVTLEDRQAAQARFLIQETEYIYRAEKTEQPYLLSDSSDADAQLLSWNTDALDLQLLAASGTTSVSWYTPESGTQWYLSANADSQEVLTTASHILRATGLNVTVAPANAQDIRYNAFLLDGLTVAETTFRIDGIAYSYRMAATTELLEDFKDISGLNGSFDRVSGGEICWCRAKLSFTEGGSGKIIWFDLVPGILYSLSMDTGCTEAGLLDLAAALFNPAQDNN